MALVENHSLFTCQSNIRFVLIKIILLLVLQLQVILTLFPIANEQLAAFDDALIGVSYSTLVEGNSLGGHQAVKIALIYEILRQKDLLERNKLNLIFLHEILLACDLAQLLFVNGKHT